MSGAYYCPEHEYDPPEGSGFALCPKCELADGGSPPWVKPGVRAWTETTSGEPILCTIIEGERDGEWLLDSPSHGYVITRHHSEMKPDV